MARTNNLSNFLTDVAGAIRTKTGSSEPIQASSFDTEIESIPSGGSKHAPKFISFFDYTGLDLQDLIDDSSLDYSNIISANSMFSLTGVTGPTTNVTTIDISKISREATGITNMQNMFQQREKLASILGLDTLDTSNVTNMGSMFNSCRTLSSLDLSNFDTSNVTNMQSMFFVCGVLSQSGELILNIKDFNVSNVSEFSSMFSNCSKLKTLNLSGWELSTTSNIKMGYMFSFCNQLTHIDMRKMNFSKVTNYYDMFGSSASNGVPNDCEIIVADDTQKTWITDKFSRLTNVKTVAEYEAEQNA